MATASPPKPLQKPNDQHVPWLLRRIWERVNRRNEHFMGVIVGQEGSGKSHTAIKICKHVDPSFNADRIIFDVTELLEELTEERHEPGNFYLLDEAGVQFGKRTWQDRAQVLANQALQLIRDHNLGLVFTLPRLSELDSQTQGRLQAAYEITQKKADEYVEGKWKFFDPSRMDDNGKIYKKYPRRAMNGERKRIRKFRFKPPETEIIDNYEERKRAFQKEVYQETIEKMRGEGEEEGEEKKTIKELAKEIKSNEGVSAYIKENHGQRYIDRDLIEVEYEIGSRRSKKLKKVLAQGLDEEVM